VSRKRSSLPLEVLSFLLATLLGIAIGNLNNRPAALPWGLELVRRQSLPLAGVTIVLMIGVMVWQYHTEKRVASPARPVWDSPGPRQADPQREQVPARMGELLPIRGIQGRVQHGRLPRVESTDALDTRQVRG
jgi:hypothetical protein